MLSDYERELSTHYAQVRKRIREGPAPKPKEPVKEPEPAQILDFVLYVNTETKIRTLIEPKRDFILVVNNCPWEKIETTRRTFQQVLVDVSRETEVPAKMLMGKRRQKYIVEARRYFWHRVASECPHLSIADIARRSGCDHTSVLHGLKRYAQANGLPHARGGVQ
jgi:chromosomal replication initiation ATPase DnaA